MTLAPTTTTTPLLKPDLLMLIFSYLKRKGFIKVSSVNRWARAAVLSDDFLSKMNFEKQVEIILEPSKLPKKSAQWKGSKILLQLCQRVCLIATDVGNENHRKLF